jgi:hypothetical protein
MDWIERCFGFTLDAGNGTLEMAMVATGALVLAVLASYRTRCGHSGCLNNPNAVLVRLGPILRFKYHEF